MAVTNYDSVVSKYEQAANGKFLSLFEQTTNKKPLIDSRTFQGKLQAEAKTLLKQSKGVLNKEASAQLETKLNSLVSKYSDDYKKVMSSKVKPKTGAASGTAAGAGIDTDPETIEVGKDSLGQKVYVTKYNGKYYKSVSPFAATNSSYSMCDMVCTIDVSSVTGQHIVATLGKLQTLSYSIYQNKTPVRVIGNMNAKDYVYGQRTIAGSLVFAVFNKHWLIEIYDKLVENGTMKNWHFVADEIPPFDITISFANEYGFDSRMAIYGVRLVNEGQTMSINDIYIENTYQYVATDIEILDSLSSWQTSNKLSKRLQNTPYAGSIASYKQKGAEGEKENADNKKLQGTDASKGDAGKEDTAKKKDSEWMLDHSEASKKNTTRSEKQKELQKTYKEKLNQIKSDLAANKKGKTKAEANALKKKANEEISKLNAAYKKETAYIKKEYKAKK